MDALAYMGKKARLVEAEINKWVPKNIRPEVLAKATRHLLETGGKKIRPCLAITACEAVGGKAGDVLEAAAALELLHTFTLIHDDIMDHDKLRRNVETVHVLWGEPVAIIAGDALFAKVFEAVAANARRLELDGPRASELFRVVSQTSFEICRGQAQDMLFENRLDITEKEYMEMVGGKTGALMEASTRVGGMLGGGNLEEVEALGKYGRLLGVAFQIQDDILGVAGKEQKFGKPIGSDLREGKRTLIVIKALEMADRKGKKLLLKVLGNKPSKKNLGAAIDLLKTSGAIDYVSRKAVDLVEEAEDCLRVLPDSEAKAALESLADFVVKREF
ncbi:MAG: polyprenyl synthetase family protein [Candidatus Hadarchaeota archaeon]